MQQTPSKDKNMNMNKSAAPTLWWGDIPLNRSIKGRNLTWTKVQNPSWGEVLQVKFGDYALWVSSAFGPQKSRGLFSVGWVELDDSRRVHLVRGSTGDLRKAILHAEKAGLDALKTAVSQKYLSGSSYNLNMALESVKPLLKILKAAGWTVLAEDLGKDAEYFQKANTTPTFDVVVDDEHTPEKLFTLIDLSTLSYNKVLDQWQAKKTGQKVHFTMKKTDTVLKYLDEARKVQRWASAADDSMDALRKLAFDMTAAPRYRDYLRRYKGPGSPMPKDEWEKKVLHKGQPPKKDEKPEAESKGDKPKGKHPIPKSMYEYIGGKAPAIQKAIDSGKPINKSDADAVVTLLEKALNSPTTTIDPTVKKHYKSLVKFLKSEASGSAKDTGDSKPKGEEKGDKADSKTKGEGDTKTKAKKTYSKKYAPAVTQVMDKHSLTDTDADEVRAFKNQKPWQGQKISDAEKLRRFLAKAKPETKERMKGISPAEFVKMLGAILDDEGDGGGKMASLDPMARLRALHTACGCGGDDHMADEDMMDEGEMAGRKWDGDKTSPDRAPYYPGKRKEIGEKPLAGQPGSAQRKQYNKWWRDNFWNAKSADALTALADLDDDTVDGILSEILFDGEVAGRKWNGQKGKGYDRKPYYPGKRKEIGEKPLAGEPGSAQRKEYNDWWRENFWNEKSAIEKPMARLAAMAVESSQVGKIILDQMGGIRRLSAMLGAKDFIHGPNWVSFKWPNRQRSKGNYLKVTLRGDDTYDMEFMNVSGMNAKTVKKHQGVYAEDLVNLFEKQTGWYLRMARDTSEAVLTAALGVEADWQTGMKDDKPVTGPGARPGEGSDVPDGEGNVEKRAFFWRERTKAAAGIDLYVAVSGGKLLGATDSKSGSSKGYWSKVPRASKAGSFDIVKLTSVPESLAEKLVDFGAANPKTSAWKSEAEAYKAVSKYLPTGKQAHLPVNDPYDFSSPDKGEVKDPPQVKAAASGNYGFPKKLAQDCDAAARRVGKAATTIAKAAYGKDARVAEFLKAHAERGNSLSAKVLLAALAEMGPKVASAGSAERLQQLREANQKTAGGSGAANAKYLSSIPAPKKVKILKAVARHYGISDTAAYDELIDRDAEAVYEYIGNDRGLALEVLRDFKSMRLASEDAEISDKTAAESLTPESLIKYLQDSKKDGVTVRELNYAFPKAGGSNAITKMLQAMVNKGDLVKNGTRYTLSKGKTASKYGLYGYREKTSKLGLSACSDLRHEAGVIASDLHRRRHDKHARISEYLTAHCKEAGCNHTQMLLDSYPSADMKFASLPAPSTIDEWIAWED